MRLRSDLTSIRPVRLMIVMVVGHFLKKTRQLIFDFWIGLCKFFKKSSPLAIWSSWCLSFNYSCVLLGANEWEKTERKGRRKKIKYKKFVKIYYLLKYSLMRSSLMFSGRLPTHRCLVSRTMAVSRPVLGGEELADEEALRAQKTRPLKAAIWPQFFTLLLVFLGLYAASYCRPSRLPKWSAESRGWTTSWGTW